MPATGAACAGAFVALRLRAFFITLWDFDLTVWFICAAAATASALSILFIKRLQEFVSKYANAGSRASYVISALCIAFCLLFEKILLWTPLENTGIQFGRLPTAALIIGAGLLLSVFVLLLLSAAKTGLSRLRSSVSQLTPKDAIAIVTLLICLNVFAWLYIKSSHTIYFWDNAGYWTTSHQLAETAREGIIPLLKSVYESIITSDYNDLIVLPWIPLVLIFGPSRWVFIAGIINLSLFPVLLLLYTYIRTFCYRPFITFLCTVCSLPMLFYTAITGFIDISGVFFTLAALLLLLRDNAEDKLIRYFAVGFFLAIAVLLRRWFAFYALAFFITLLADGFLFVKSPIPFLSAFFSFVFSLLFLFQPFVTDRLIKNYGSLYSAYAMGVGTDFHYLFYYFGLFVLAAALLGGVYKITQPTLRRQGVFLLLLPTICFYLFTRVQSHGQQHLLLYVPPLFCLLAAAYGALDRQINRRKGYAVLMAVTAILSFSHPFFERERPSTSAEIKTYAAFPSLCYVPPSRTDTDEIIELVRYLDATAGAYGKTVGVLASSFTLNVDILLNAEVSIGTPRISDIDRSYLLRMPEVDGRDPLPGALFQSDFLLVANPVQLHLGTAKQQSIAIPAEAVLSGNGFGAAYRPTGETFYIGHDHSIKVQLYEKTREITQAEQDALLDTYAATKAGN